MRVTSEEDLDAAGVRQLKDESMSQERPLLTLEKHVRMP